MVSNREKLWLIFIISGILGIIGFFIPFDVGITLLWYWGPFPYDIMKVEHIIAILFIIGGGVLLLILGIYNKKTEKHNLDPLGFFAGLFLIIGPIVYTFGGITISIPMMMFEISFWFTLAGGILGLSVGLIGIIKNFEGGLSKLSRFGGFVTVCGFLGYFVNFLIPSTASWAYYYVVGPAWILIGFIIFAIGILKSMFK